MRLRAQRKSPNPSAPVGASSEASQFNLIVPICLVAAAFAISVYLGWVSWQGGGLAGCGPESACDQVLSSRWSRLGPLPVSWGAVVVDGLWLGSLLALTAGGPQSTLARLAIGCAVLVAGSALWFIALQLFILKAVCPYCMVAHACGLVAAARTFKTLGPVTPLLRPAWIIGSALALCLVLGQVFLPARTQTASVVQQPAPISTATPAERILSLYGGAFQLKPAELPMLGSVDAAHLIVSLFDYTCHHCRDMHSFLKQQVTNYAGALGVISLPMPLDAQCNWLMRKTPPAHSNSCAYAQLGLAVFQAAPSRSAEYDEWLFTGAQPPPLETARRRAAEIAGPAALNLALTNGWVQRRIQEDISLYASNYAKIGRGQMPQLIIGDLVSVGVIDGQAQFDQMVSQQWGLTNQSPATKTP